jgi:hypothetical protein
MTSLRVAACVTWCGEECSQTASAYVARPLLEFFNHADHYVCPTLLLDTTLLLCSSTQAIHPHCIKHSSLVIVSLEPSSYVMPSHNNTKQVLSSG